jgi:hypothetical protein
MSSLELSKGTLMALSKINLKKLRKKDPKAADVLETAIGAADYIEERLAKMAAQGRGDETLFVAIGESHSDVNHLIFETLLIEKLLEDKHSLVVGLELPYDLVDQLSGNRSQPGYASSMRRPKIRMNEKQNPCAHLDLIQKRHAFFSDNAPYASKTLYKNLARNLSGSASLLSVPFTDAACDDDDKVIITNFKDRSIIQGLKKRFNESRLDVEAYGIYIRNHFMTQKLIEQVDKHKPRIAIQLAGRAHLSGIYGELSAEDSLMGCFHCAGKNYMQIHCGDAEDLQDNHPGLEFVYQPLSDETAEYGANGNRILTTDGPLELNSHKKEAAYVDGRLKNMGLKYLTLKG